eukprot:GHVS01103692.1.p1 GENE.GHVS01103692.1~~GHVS01103692.1.p1  ORF type:complete len:120 (-),score=2.05 GHVS01103692.1:216-536(-)
MYVHYTHIMCLYIHVMYMYVHYTHIMCLDIHVMYMYIYNTVVVLLSNRKSLPMYYYYNCVSSLSLLLLLLWNICLSTFFFLSPLISPVSSLSRLIAIVIITTCLAV